MDKRTIQSEAHYRNLFEHSPISFWEEDFSEVKKQLDGIRKKGVKDFRAYFEAHPQELVDCYSSIKVLDVNQAVLDRYEAKSKEELFEGLSSVFTEQSLANLKEELIALAEGKNTFRSEMYGRTLKGGYLHNQIFLTIVPGHEDTWDKVILCDIDISEQKRLESELKLRSEREAALGALSQNFVELTALRPFLEEAIRIIQQTLNMEFVMILECSELRDSLSMRAGVVSENPLSGFPIITLEEDLLFGRTLNSQQAVVVKDLPGDDRLNDHLLVTDHHLVSGMSVLIGSLESPWGILAAFSSNFRHITENEVHFVEAVARLLNMAIDRVEVQEQQEMLVAAIAQTAELVIITNLLGIVQYVNPAVEKITGYSIDQVLGRDVLSLNNGEEDTRVTKEAQRSMQFDQVWNGHFKLQKDDGLLLTLETTISPVRDRNEQTINYVVVMRDITEYLELENQLRHAQKSQAIGTLAGGIAHDFNNILAGIMGFTDLAKECSSEEGELGSILNEIDLGARRAKELVEQILTFSRKGEHTWRPVRIQRIVQDAVKMLRNVIPATIDIHSHINPDYGIIEANESQIHQVIMNLCSNAYQAMEPGGGTLKIDVEEIRLESAAANVKGLKEGNFIRIEVSDTGHGMDEATKARIFEPYFTTREQGLGTGLGLSTVLGIVETHGGRIFVESVADKGSQFEVLLPTHRSKPSTHLLPKVTEDDSNSLPMGNGEHILFVDDEEPIIKFSESALKKFGYRVTATVCSDEALKAFRSRPEDFDLVVTDQIMPRMTGMQLANQIHAIRPEVPVILCTGYSESINREEVHEAGLSGFYIKPISTRELRRKIRRALVSH